MWTNSQNQPRQSDFPILVKVNDAHIIFRSKELLNTVLVKVNYQWLSIAKIVSGSMPAADSIVEWLRQLLNADYNICLSYDYLKSAITELMRDSDVGLAVKLEQIIDNAYSDYSDVEKLELIKATVKNYLK